MANATCVKQTEMPLIIFKKHSNSIEFQHELKRVNISVSDSAGKIITKIPFGTETSNNKIYPAIFSVRDLTACDKQVSLKYLYELAAKKRLSHFPLDALTKTKSIFENENKTWLRIAMGPI